MGLGTNHEDATSLAVLINEVWSGQAINDFFKNSLHAAKHFWDVSELLSGGGDIIHIPNITEMTANTKVNGSEVTLNNSTETAVDLTVSTWYEVSFLIEKREAKQVLGSYMLQERYAKNAAYTCAKKLDAALLGLYTGLSQTVGASTAAISDSTIRSAIQYVRTANAPYEELAFFFNSNQIWGDLMAIDRYVLLNEGGAGAVNGQAVAKLYGLPVYETNNLVTTSTATVAHGLLAHKEAFVFGTHGVELDANYIPQYLGVLVTADIIYGVAENRDTAAVHILSNN